MKVIIDEKELEFLLSNYYFHNHDYKNSTVESYFNQIGLGWAVTPNETSYFSVARKVIDEMEKIEEDSMIVDKEDYINLLASDIEMLNLLENGVDNWSGFGLGMPETISFMLDRYGIKIEQEVADNLTYKALAELIVEKDRK